MRAIALAVSEAELATLFRNNVGVGWQGRIVRHEHGKLIILENPRPLHAGLCEGSADLVGWSARGLFTGLEVKRAGKKLTNVQQNFGERVAAAGGIFARVDSIESALAAFQ